MNNFCIQLDCVDKCKKLFTLFPACKQNVQLIDLAGNYLRNDSCRCVCEKESSSG